MARVRIWGPLALAACAVVAACAAPTPAPTRLDITARQTICGGTIPPPGQPFCRTGPSSRPLEVRAGRDLVATGTSGADGHLVLEVPTGRLTVAVADAQPYEQCDAPTVSAAAGLSTPVTQTCTINAP
ncbi:MAG: hypothetical protein ACOYOP_12575 [Microthrixaceae bacterium]